MFHEFLRLPQQGRRQVKGLGLGLAIADRICRLLGHRITVQSWPDKGTVFSVYVPLAGVTTVEEPAAGPGPALEDRRDLVGTRVFCVDNDPALLASLEALLRALGCEPVTAGSREEALRQARGQPEPDLLLVDYQLDDGETGFQVIEALDGYWEDVVPAMLITADRRAEVQARAREKGGLPAEAGQRGNHPECAARAVTVTALFQPRRFDGQVLEGKHRLGPVAHPSLRKMAVIWAFTVASETSSS